MSKRARNKSDQPKQVTQNEKKLKDGDFIVSKTDRSGKIIYVNQIFTSISGYLAVDLIGANHNLIRHPDMPKIAFKVAWDLIQKKKEFFGFVKNLCADGSYYWVFAYITADLDDRGHIISYTSIRRKSPQSAIDTIVPIYKMLLDAEMHGGVKASEARLNEYLSEQGVGYDEFVINLQKDIRV